MSRATALFSSELGIAPRFHNPRHSTSILSTKKMFSKEKVDTTGEGEQEGEGDDEDGKFENQNHAQNLSAMLTAIPLVELLGCRLGHDAMQTPLVDTRCTGSLFRAVAAKCRRGQREEVQERAMPRCLRGPGLLGRRITERREFCHLPLLHGSGTRSRISASLEAFACRARSHMNL